MYFGRAVGNYLVPRPLWFWAEILFRRYHKRVAKCAEPDVRDGAVVPFKGFKIAFALQIVVIFRPLAILHPSGCTVRVPLQRRVSSYSSFTSRKVE